MSPHSFRHAFLRARFASNPPVRAHTMALFPTWLPTQAVLPVGFIASLDCATSGPKTRTRGRDQLLSHAQTSLWTQGTQLPTKSLQMRSQARNVCSEGACFGPPSGATAGSRFARCEWRARRPVRRAGSASSLLYSAASHIFLLTSVIVGIQWHSLAFGEKCPARILD